jgi:benzoate/toluate 1,2-dioxygenase subunit beta
MSGAAPTLAKVSSETLREIEQFLYRQSEILDERRWLDFVDLFTADGVYWMPAEPEQTTGEGVPAIFHEDRNLMTVRAKRITHPRAWSQAPMWGTSHLVSNVVIEEHNQATGALVVRSRFHLMEFRRDASRHFAGSYRHHLVPAADGYRIKLQRVDMVNGQGPYDYVLQAWV